MFHLRELGQATTMLNASGQIISDLTRPPHKVAEEGKSPYFTEISLGRIIFFFARCITFSMSLVQLLGPLLRRRGDGKATAPSQSGWKILDATCTETWAFKKNSALNNQNKVYNKFIALLSTFPSKLYDKTLIKPLFLLGVVLMGAVGRAMKC